MKISNKIKTIAAGSSAVILSGLNASAAFADGEKAVVRCPDGTKATDLTKCKGVDSENNTNNLTGIIVTIINVIIGVIGFVAVLMIILGGVQYTTSAGDPGKVKKAKDTILYGIVGLVIALLAFAIVNFVLGAIGGGK
ncbi:hypothetical protein IJI76_01705 [Candidatus Saccharibacteria bacterium]|nr:hypothetical protein [Candidatus Saccharibacteria bacterium]